ncbi:MAG: hypothetical protein ABL993_12580 [Vicinamibacterales bacterium]
MNDGPRIEKLRREHAVDLFDCGQEALNRFLARYAFQHQQAEASQTYVGLVDDDVVGFYTLVVALVEYDDAPRRFAKAVSLGNPEWKAVHARGFSQRKRDQ